MLNHDELAKAYENIKRILSSHNFVVDDYKSINYGLQFNVSKANWSGKLRIYQSERKGINVDYSLLDKDNSINIKDLVEGKEIGSTSESSHKEKIGYPIIGTDESGKGDYFGPLVIAGVYVDESTATKLEVLGIKDSKKLSNNKNLRLAQDIMKICKGNFSVIEISPEKYNNLYEDFRKENKNLNVMLAWGHSKAIEEILENVECETAIVDQFAGEEVILQKLQEKGRKLNLIQRHRAEENLAVAAASILARARYLEKLSALSKQYGIILPKGASEAVTKCGEEFIKLHGFDSLKKVAKVHFKTTSKLRESLK